VTPDTGIVLWEVNGSSEINPAVEPYIGKEYKDGELFCVIENKNGQLVSIPANMGGRLVEIAAKQGSAVRRGDVLAYIERNKE
jgi:pyruvate carboxylase subunit B